LGVERLSTVLEEHKAFLKLLDSAIMAYHSLKINQVNALLRDYWRLTYRGKDIDCIELKAEQDTSRKVKSYNYRLVLHGSSTDMDMRGRCSAGQKILASLVLRLALAQAFSGVCGVIALDEPTTALDKENTQGLAEVLAEFVQLQQVQLIVITHDMDFVESLMRLTQQGMFYEVEKVKEESRVSVRTIR
jgi:DNA repair protein RAD50